MNSRLNYKPWSAEVSIATGDSSKTLAAAVAGASYVVTRLTATVYTAAAQLVTIAAGTTTILKIPASGTGQYQVGPMERGLVGQSGTAIIITPASAGPAIHVSAEGYLLPS